MRLRTALRVGFALLALTAIVLVVDHVGVEAFVSAMRRALPLLPILLALEALRIATDLVALRSTCGSDARRVPFAAWVRLHLEANAACVILPGGRAVSEGMKIARLGPVLGGGRAAALVATQHVATMIAIACTSALGAAATAWIGGPRALAAAMLIHAGVTLGAACALRVALGRARLPSRVGRWVGPHASELREAARSLPFVAPAPLAAKLVNRAAQIAQLGLLLFAITATTRVPHALVAGGASLLGGVVGELSLAQLGCTDAALSLSASTLSIGASSALAVASVVRVVQLAWSAVGAAFPLLDSTHGKVWNG